MDKVCTRCNISHSIEEFPIINSLKGKRSSMDAECKREYDREHYHKHGDRKRKNKRITSAKYRSQRRTFIIDFLKISSCKDCGISDWRVLEFDHIDRFNKSFNLADSTSFSIETIRKEISKCDVVCANCHNIRTINQRGYYKFLRK